MPCGGHSSAIAAAKAAMRSRLLDVRALVHRADDGSRSEQLCRRLDDVLGDQVAALVAYEASGAEIDPRRFADGIAERGVPMFSPSWGEGRNDFVNVETSMPLSDPDWRVIILVPGVAFDRRGGRLGRGQGWYDQMLARYPNATRVGCAYDEQLVSQVPCERWDVVMHCVVTDARSFQVPDASNTAGVCAYERS